MEGSQRRMVLSSLPEASVDPSCSVSGQCGGRDETRPVSAGGGGGRSTGEKATHATGYLCPLSGTPTVSPAHGGEREAFVKSLL